MGQPRDKAKTPREARGEQGQKGEQGARPQREIPGTRWRSRCGGVVGWRTVAEDPGQGMLSLSVKVLAWMATTLVGLMVL